VDRGLSLIWIDRFDGVRQVHERPRRHAKLPLKLTELHRAHLTRGVITGHPVQVFRPNHARLPRTVIFFASLPTRVSGASRGMRGPCYHAAGGFLLSFAQITSTFLASDDDQRRQRLGQRDDNRGDGLDLPSSHLSHHDEPRQPVAVVRGGVHDRTGAVCRSDLIDLPFFKIRFSRAFLIVLYDHCTMPATPFTPAGGDATTGAGPTPGGGGRTPQRRAGIPNYAPAEIAAAVSAMAHASQSKSRTDRNEQARRLAEKYPILAKKLWQAKLWYRQEDTTHVDTWEESVSKRLGDGPLDPAYPQNSSKMRTYAKDAVKEIRKIHADFCTTWKCIAGVWKQRKRSPLRHKGLHLQSRLRLATGLLVQHTHSCKWQILTKGVIGKKAPKPYTSHILRDVSSL